MGRPALTSRASGPDRKNRGVDKRRGVRRKGSGDSSSKGAGALNVEPRNFGASKDIASMSQTGGDKEGKVNAVGYQQGSGNSRKPSSQGGFLFTARQDPSGSILNGYTSSNQNLTNGIPGIGEGKDQMIPPSSARKSLSVDSNFPSYYMDHRDSVSQGDTDFVRQRGDSILYHPQFTNQTKSAGADYNSSSSRQGNSRSNSIFSSLIQLPASNGNSVSEPGELGTVQPTVDNTNETNNTHNDHDSNELSNLNKVNDNDKTRSRNAGDNTSEVYRPRQQSAFQSISGLDQISIEELENFLNKESLGNILAWQQSQEGRNSQSKDKGTPNEYPMFDNNISTGSISGFSGSVGEIIAGISNGSIDFTGMTDRQRRDSLLKILSDSQSAKRPKLPSLSSEKTTLREDIFESANSNRQRLSNNSLGTASTTSAVGNKPKDPSLSFQSSRYPDEPQSPRASPAYPMSVKPAQYGVAQYRAPENGAQNSRVIGDYRVQANPDDCQYNEYGQSQISNNGGANKYGQPQFINQAPIGHVSNVQQQINQNYQYQVPQNDAYQSTNGQNELVPAQQYVKAEDGRPLLGVTKIDQLMLVIQARDKGVTNPIKQAPDGSILQGQDEERNKQSVFPQPVSLVGGVDKPGKRPKEEEKGATIESQGTKKKKSKNQQCPYCFKYFTQSTHLEVHVRSHIGYKPFECSFCHKRFTQGGNLRTHLRLHTGEKPFTCEVCNRSFSRKGNLAAHKLTHENLKPYHCRLDGCDKSFTQLGNLKSHQNRFHLATLNNLTHRLAELSGPELENLPKEEKELLSYFKDLYKNSNKGIRGRGKRADASDSLSQSPNQLAPQVNTQFIP